MTTAIHFPPGPWLMHPRALLDYRTQLPLVADDYPRPTARRDRSGDGRSPDVDPRDSVPLDVRSGVAVIPVSGPLYRTSTYSNDLMAWAFGGTCYADVRLMLDAALNRADVKSIVFEVDSPGGEALGCGALASAIRGAAKVKPTAAFVSGMGTSAAYWIASSAGEITADPSAILGSIGTVCPAFDDRKFQDMIGIKDIPVVSEQSPKKWLMPWTDEGRETLQEEINALASVFIAAVADYRGVSASKVTSDFGMGGCLIGGDARKAGLADRVGTLDDVVSKMSGPNRARLAVHRPAAAAAKSACLVRGQDGTVRLVIE